MKTLTLFLIITLFYSGCTSVPKRSNFKLKPYEEKTLSNGLKVLLVKDKSLPSFSVMMLMKSGSTSDPIGRSGLSYMTASLLEKGTRKRNAIEVADSFGQLGSEFGWSVSKDYSTFSASSLSFHKDTLLDDFAEVLLKPSFKKSEINRMKKQIVSKLEKTVDSPSTFASVAFTNYLYGSHPYARRSIGSVIDVNAIKKKDINKYYLKHYRPNNMIMAVVGDFDDTIMATLEKKFGSWKPRNQTEVNFTIFPSIEGVQIRLVGKNDLAQTQVIMGHKGIKRNNPDYLTVSLANTILGGAFHSRLMNEIRVKRGLTYGINSHFSALQSEGPFFLSSSTRHEKVGELISESLNVLKRFQKEGVSSDEVKDAKALLKGSFPRIVETSESLASNLLVHQFYNIPKTYLSNYLKNVDAITKSDVNRVIKKYYDPENMKVLVFSPKGKVIEQLRPIGTVQVMTPKEVF